jgi:DNA-binding NarL/FixJ family response regulator
VIDLVVDGLTNKEIVQTPHLSTFTVKNHIYGIMEKLALHTFLEVANYSYSTRIIKKIVRDIPIVKEKLISRLAQK